MKKKHILIYKSILMGLLLIFADSCKKKDSTDDTTPNHKDQCECEGQYYPCKVDTLKYEGYVLDTIGGKPVENAIVNWYVKADFMTFSGIGKTTDTTDANGYYSLLVIDNTEVENFCYVKGHGRYLKLWAWKDGVGSSDDYDGCCGITRVDFTLK